MGDQMRLPLPETQAERGTGRRCKREPSAGSEATFQGPPARRGGHSHELREQTASDAAGEPAVGALLASIGRDARFQTPGSRPREGRDGMSGTEQGKGEDSECQTDAAG